MTKEERAMLRKVKVGAIIMFGMKLIDKETFGDLMHFEKLSIERQRELVQIVESLKPDNQDSQ